MQLPTPLLDNFRHSESGGSFELLFDRKYPLIDVGELFRQQYEIFRGFPITTRLGRDVQRDVIILEESGQREAYISSLANLDEDDYFALTALNADGRIERFYQSLKRRFRQE